MILRGQIRNRAAVLRTSRLNSPVGSGGKQSQQPRLSSVITRCGPNRCQQPEDGALLIKKGPPKARDFHGHRRRALRWSTTTSDPPRREILAKPAPQSLNCRLHPPKTIDRTDPSVAAHLPPPLELFCPSNGSGADWRARQRHSATLLLLQAHRQPPSSRGVSPSAALARGPGKPASVGVWGDVIRGDIERCFGDGGLQRTGQGGWRGRLVPVCDALGRTNCLLPVWEAARWDRSQHQEGFRGGADTKSPVQQLIVGVRLNKIWKLQGTTLPGWYLGNVPTQIQVPFGI